MACGEHQGMDLTHPSVRELFTREHLLSSTWYQERLAVKKQRDVALWSRHVAYVETRRQHAEEIGKTIALEALRTLGSERDHRRRSFRLTESWK